MIFGMNKAWIPNSLTMGNLLFGFLSLILAAQGSYQLAGIAILLAALFDGFDGQVARMLKVTSKIGAELDSLADCVTFGVAPGYLAYNAYLSHIRFEFLPPEIPVGGIIAAIYPLCAAYRLARFNVTHVSDSFSGLPSPIAGIIVALVPLAVHDAETIREALPVFLPMFIITALLMVSTVRFSKPQANFFKKFHGIKLFLLIVLIIILAILARKYIIFVSIGLILLYIISSLTSFIIQFIQDRKY